VTFDELIAIFGGDMDGLRRLGAARGVDANSVGAGLIRLRRKPEPVGGSAGQDRLDEQFLAGQDRAGLGDFIPGGEIGPRLGVQDLHGERQVEAVHPRMHLDQVAVHVDGDKLVILQRSD
jgi:hypothetical protein